MFVETLHRIIAQDASEKPGAARAFLTHVVSLTATKTADSIINPKLVLSWLLGTLGAPAWAVGALVPVREAGALLPQIALAPRVAASRQRKWFWVAGSFAQGMAALGIAASALWLEGVAAGVAIVGFLAILAIARSSCSVSYKDALARTVAKGERGTVSGTAGSLASVFALGFAALLAAGIVPLEPVAIAGAIVVAAALWIGASLLFMTLDEPKRTNGDAPGIGIGRLVEVFRDDAQLALFIAARGLLTATALAPPFLVMMSGREGDSALGQLGVLMIASAAASIASSWLWGRLSDRSSRQTLMAGGAIGAVTLGIAAGYGWSTDGLGGTVGTAAAIFAAQIAYAAVRTGRKTHLTDMTGDDRRALYTALSNTVIGIVLLVGGGFGLLAEVAGAPLTLAVLAAMCALAVPVAATLDEVQRT